MGFARGLHASHRHPRRRGQRCADRSRRQRSPCGMPRPIVTRTSSTTRGCSILPARPTTHVGFGGGGAHFCPVRTLPGARSRWFRRDAQPGSGHRRYRRAGHAVVPFIHGIKRLPVSWTPRSNNGIHQGTFALGGPARRSCAQWPPCRLAGDPQARLVADLAVRANPFPFYDELRAQGPLIRARVSHLTVDHAVPTSCCAQRISGSSPWAGLPPPLRWLEERTAPSCCTRCNRHHSWPSSHRSTRAIARRCLRCSPLERWPHCATAWKTPPRPC